MLDRAGSLKLHAFRSSHQKSLHFSESPRPASHLLPHPTFALPQARYCAHVPIQLTSKPRLENGPQARTNPGIGRQRCAGVRNQEHGAGEMVIRGRRTQVRGRSSEVSGPLHQTTLHSALSTLHFPRSTLHQQCSKIRAPCVWQKPGALAFLPWILRSIQHFQLSHPATRWSPCSRTFFFCAFSCFSWPSRSPDLPRSPHRLQSRTRTAHITVPAANSPYDLRSRERTPGR